MSITNISWTATKDDRGNTFPGYTLNWWIGCSHVSDGCKHCYAERENNIYHWVTGWGPGWKRKLTTPGNRAKVFTWARQAKNAQQLRRVFVSSLSDVFDSEVPQEWREDLWECIDDARKASGGFLEFLVLTKRIENARTMLPINWLTSPSSNPHVILGVTTENQEMADKRIPVLLNVWNGGRNFISAEPLLGNIDFTSWLYGDKQKINWIIVGGESGSYARYMDTSWAFRIITQCKESNTPVFIKQMGSFWSKMMKANSSHGSNIYEWDPAFRVQEII